MNVGDIVEYNPTSADRTNNGTSSTEALPALVIAIDESGEDDVYTVRVFFPNGQDRTYNVVEGIDGDEEGEIRAAGKKPKQSPAPVSSAAKKDS